MQEFNIDVIGEILNSTKRKPLQEFGFYVFILTMPIQKCLTTWTNYSGWPIKKFNHDYLQPICSPSFSFMGEVGKSKEIKDICQCKYVFFFLQNSSLFRKSKNVKTRKENMRLPGVEPGSIAWKAIILTVGLQTLNM